MSRCIWCGKKTGDSIKIILNADGEEVYVCGEKCEKAVKDYLNKANQNVKYFFIGLVGFMIVGLALIVIETINKRAPNWGLLIMLLGMGATIAVFPYATPQTNEMFGIKKASAIGRFVGVAMIILGIVFFFVI